MAQTAVEIAGDPTALYRLYDITDRLLYVGITKDLNVRFSQHAADKWWWPLVIRKTAMLYGSREDALAAEATAIVTEAPVHNIAGRRDEYPEKESKEVKVKRLVRQLVVAERLVRHPPVSYTLPSDIVAELDSYAKDHQISQAEAFIKFFLAGMLKCYEDDSAAMRAERAELEALIAAREAVPA